MNWFFDILFMHLVQASDSLGAREMVVGVCKVNTLLNNEIGDAYLPIFLISIKFKSTWQMSVHATDWQIVLNVF